MSQFEITPVQPSMESVQNIFGAVQEDLGRMGMLSSEYQRYADVTNDDLVKQLLDNLELALDPENTLSYQEIVVDGEFKAYSKTNEWKAGDQAKFASTRMGEFGMKALIRLGNHVPGQPLGIHGLVVRRTVGEADRVDMTNALLDDAISHANLGEVRIAQHAYDPIKKEVLGKGFIPSGKFGYPIGSVQQELYIRPEDPALARVYLESIQRAGITL